MADIDEVIGSVLAGIAHARRIADEQTALIAEHYRDNPLLEGMSVPRLRLPSVTIEIPVVIDEQLEGEDEEPESATNMTATLKKTVTELAGQRQFTLPRGFITEFETGLKKSFAALRPRRAGHREAYARVAEDTFLRVAKDRRFAGSFKEDPSFVRVAKAHLRDVAERTAIRKPAVPPRLELTVVTGQVKEKADPENVTRLRLTLREEGLEWSISEDEEGKVSKKLVPE